VIRDNHYYGHSTVLRRYLGVSDDFRFPCGIQHGWSTGPGLYPEAFRLPWTKMLWARRNLDECRAAGYERCTAIGAPFLYLPERAVLPAEPRSLLAFPSHGWEQRKLTVDLEEYARSVERLERDGFGPVTICMYWFEHDQPDLRAIFERRGWPVTTVGHREHTPEFLFEQRELIQRHSYVTTNRLATVGFYALAAHRRFFLHGPYEGMQPSDPTGELFAAWTRAHFPELHYDTFGDRVHTDVAELELGLEFKRGREELLELMSVPWPGEKARRSWPQKVWREWQRVKRRVRARQGDQSKP
jgi:hypothetical protein